MNICRKKIFRKYFANFLLLRSFFFFETLESELAYIFFPYNVNIFVRNSTRALFVIFKVWSRRRNTIPRCCRSFFFFFVSQKLKRDAFHVSFARKEFENVNAQITARGIPLHTEIFLCCVRDLSKWIWNSGGKNSRHRENSKNLLEFRRKKIKFL